MLRFIGTREAYYVRFTSNSHPRLIERFIYLRAPSFVMKERIIADPKILAGKPVIRGTRIPVYLVLNLLAKGKTAREIVLDYPELTEEDIAAAIEYAAAHMKYEELRPLETSR